MKKLTGDVHKEIIREMFETWANELNNNELWTFGDSVVLSAVVGERQGQPVIDIELTDGLALIRGDAFVKSKESS